MTEGKLRWQAAKRENPEEEEKGNDPEREESQKSGKWKMQKK